MAVVQFHHARRSARFLSPGGGSRGRRGQKGAGARGVHTRQRGFDTRYGMKDLAGRGISPAGSFGGVSKASLLELDIGSGYEYWLGSQNFYTITRYNHSTYYAMAVHQLARAIAARKGGPSDTRVSYRSDVVPESYPGRSG